MGESSRFSTASPSKESSLGEGPIQLVWPTVSEVRSSLLGYAAGGSIPGNTRNLAKPHVAARLHAWRALGELRKTEPKTETSSARLGVLLEPAPLRPRARGASHQDVHAVRFAFGWSSQIGLGVPRVAQPVRRGLG